MHCKAPNHNSGGCALKKQGISSEEAKKIVAAAAQQQTEEHTNEPINFTTQVTFCA
jgi:hypothetical protein